mmetsp:Transcript_21063/g.48710  ORF Transcript_21063/g.48710 Transcript_21063/m.48710 type:complete len:217 (+) Transcript_21063:374-1024(+)
MHAPKVARGPEHGAARHEEEQRMGHAEKDGPHQQRPHLGEEEERAQEQDPPREGRREPPPDDRAPHVREGEARLGLAGGLVPSLLVHVAEMHRVVNREANDNNPTDRLRDAEIPPVVHLHGAEHPDDDHCDGDCGKEGEEDVARRHDEDTKDNGEADREPREEVLDESVLHRSPSESAAWPLQVGEEDGPHPLRRPRPQPVGELLQIVVDEVTPSV